MSIETLDDIVEEVANHMGRYGEHDESRCENTKLACRCCYVAQLTSRIRDAVEVERKLAAPRATQEPTR